MKLSLTFILGAVLFAYSTGIVLYHELTHSLPPDGLLFPIYPGIWVGVQADNLFHGSMLVAYAAGIGTMTLIGAVLGYVFELLCGGRRSGAT